MPDWLAQLREALAAGPAALVSILAAEGSTPRDAGARMIVSADRVWGTIGGGALEFRAIAQARAALGRPAGAWAVQDYPLGPLLAQCCGGRVRLLVEHLDSSRLGWLDEARMGRMLVSRFEAGAVERSVADGLEPRPASARGPAIEAGAVLVEAIGAPAPPLLLYGAGHVGRAIARAARGLPFDLAWFDPRPDEFEAPDAARLPEEELLARASAAGADAAVLILTHDHGLDYRLVRAALEGAAGFIGLIGSRTKRARFVSRLAADAPAADPSRIVCPIGLPDVVGKAPEVIAISVMAQLLSRPVARSGAADQSCVPGRPASPG
jgi:xanthine dehydrogenase accessory factor